MSQLIKEKFAIPLVVFAGLLWSFGPLVVRNMDEPGLVPWQYLCGRGIVIFFFIKLLFIFWWRNKILQKLFKNRYFGNYRRCWSWNSNDYFYLVDNQYKRCYYFIVFSCNAFYYIIIRFFVFKRKNIL